MYNEIIKFIAPTIEILYFIAGIIVAVAAVIALKQIAIMKETASNQSKRDAIKISSEQCNNYLTNIIKLQNDFYQILKNKNISYKDNWTVDIDGNNIVIHYNKEVDFVSFYHLDFCKVFNAMEAFATYFTNSLADEMVAYFSLGTTYINQVETYLPFLLDFNNDGYYLNIVKLYLIWKKRMISIELKQQQKKINDKMRKCKSETIKPVGVK